MNEAGSCITLSGIVASAFDFGAGLLLLARDGGSKSPVGTGSGTCGSCCGAGLLLLCLSGCCKIGDGLEPSCGSYGGG